MNIKKLFDEIEIAIEELAEEFNTCREELIDQLCKIIEEEEKNQRKE